MPWDMDSRRDWALRDILQLLTPFVSHSHSSPGDQTNRAPTNKLTKATVPVTQSKRWAFISPLIHYRGEYPVHAQRCTHPVSHAIHSENAVCFGAFSFDCGMDVWWGDPLC